MLEPNPFEDASIQNLPDAGGVHQAESSGYQPPALANPFDDQITEKSPVLGALATENIYETPTDFTSVTVNELGSAGNAGDEQRLRAKEAELIEREKLITEREAQFDKMGVKPPNWPPFRPIIYNDINADIPEQYKVHVQRLFYTVVGLWATLVLNWLIMMLTFLFGKGGGIGGVIWSTIYAGLGIPASWRGWYQSVYKSLKNGGSSIRWWMFIIGYFSHTAFVCIGAAGFPSFAQSGLLWMLNVFGQSKPLGFIALICFVCWGLLALASVLLFRASWNLFRDSDAQKNIKGDLARTAVSMQLQNAT